MITDPVGVVPVFLAITADATAGERRRAAWQAVVVAAVVLATFALFGQQILLYLGISVPSLQVAGGLLLLMIALDLLRGETERLSGRPGPMSPSCPWTHPCWPDGRDRGHHGLHPPSRARRPAPGRRPGTGGVLAVL